MNDKSPAMEALRRARENALPIKSESQNKPNAKRYGNGNHQMKNENKVIKIAQPGYYVLELSKDENSVPDAVIRHPVIAWLFDFSIEDVDSPEAICLGGNVDRGSSWLRNAPLLCPDGLVRAGIDSHWESESEYFQECVDRAKRWQESLERAILAGGLL